MSQAHAAEVEAERAWFASIGTQLVAADAGATVGVRVRYLGDNGLEDEISSHFGDPDWLRVEREGPLPWAGGYGGMVVVLLDSEGRPVEGAQCEWIPLDDSVGCRHDLRGQHRPGRKVCQPVPARDAVPRGADHRRKHWRASLGGRAWRSVRRGRYAGNGVRALEPPVS